jgi:hypothetical protein
MYAAFDITLLLKPICQMPTNRLQVLSLAVFQRVPDASIAAAAGKKVCIPFQSFSGVRFY